MLSKLPKHIQNRITICPNKGCWLVDGCPTPNGYMRVWHRGIRYMAHKIVFELVTGKEPPKDNKQYDHICEVRACANPEHIEIVTPSVNCKRKYRRRKKI